MKRSKNVLDGLAVVIITLFVCCMIFGFGFICYDLYKHEPAMLLMFPGLGSVVWALSRLGDDTPVKKRKKRSSK